MLKCLFLLLLSFTSYLIFAQDIPVTVFESGKDGYKNFRIPAMINLPNGDILAFSEGRVNNAGDFGDINVVLKRSTDKGKTWGPLQLVADYDNLQAGNPAPVVDLTDPLYPKGRIFLFYNTGNNHEADIRKANGFKQVWYKTSIDAGKTWSEAIDITTQVHRLKQPSINPQWNFSEDWRYYANTPGHALQFRWGKYKGRIYVAANHTTGDPKNKFEDYNAHGFYSDDHGKTFKISENVSFPGSNESMAAELQGDKLMMNSRNQQGDVRQRIVSISSDGGAKWDATYFDKNLPDPVNQGSVLSFKDKKGKFFLAFCNAADTKTRDNLTLRISDNEGKSWFKNIVVNKNPTDVKSDYTAYSDLIKLDDSKIGVLYEFKDYSKIVFATVNWRKTN
jgi:sialidase-1